MKLLPGLVIVLVLCLIAITLPAVPAQAECGVPVIKLSPSSGTPGTEVTVNGQLFDADAYVGIYYDGTRETTGRTDSSGDFTILFTVPERYTGACKVRAEEDSSTYADAVFTVEPGLTVSPEKGPVGTDVTVRGRGFAKNEEGIALMYYLNGSCETVEGNITANAKGSWKTSFPIPQSTMGEHKIDAQGDVSKLYEVKDGTFEVTGEVSTDKSSGIVDDTITMTGSRFMGYETNIQILFAGQTVVTDIKANAQGEWEASFKVPEMPAGTYSVTAEKEQTRKEDIIVLSFEIKPGIVLSPGEGHVGMNLTASGHGFAASEDVVTKYDGSQKAIAETNDKGSFEVSFPVPESQHGERQVTAADAAENEASAIFTLESDPPSVPAIISPSNGRRVGLIGSVKPTFEWSEVSDDSRVRYSLQIATSANVTATGRFVYPIFSVEGLVGMNYTLEKKDALPYGTYYWIVQAVDGAENAGGWTAARSFRAGLLPLWGFIAIITATAVVIIALIRFLLIRRGIYH